MAKYFIVTWVRGYFVLLAILHEFRLSVGFASDQRCIGGISVGLVPDQYRIDLNPSLFLSRLGHKRFPGLVT